MQIILTIFLFLLGASFGSFISVLNDRIKKGKKGIIFGRSVCPKCKKKLGAADLVPLFSYLILRGKCRHCGKKISAHYPALEIITGLAFVAMLMRYPFMSDTLAIEWGNMLVLAINFVYTIFLVAVFFFDLQHSEIPDAYLFPFIGVSLAGSLIIGSPDIISMVMAAVGSFVFFGGQYFLSKGKWLGEGDIYLGIAMALILGWQLLLIGLAVSYLLGGFVSVILMTAKKATGKTQIPFAPFLVLGTFMAIFFGNEVISWYMSLLIL
jgi:leader peptidase (prepilin peptidase) / N-methyltransferase